MGPILVVHSISSTNRTEYKPSVELDAEEQSIPACQAELAGIPRHQQIHKRMNYIIHLSIITALLTSESQSAQLLETGHQLVPSLAGKIKKENRYVSVEVPGLIIDYFKKVQNVINANSTKLPSLNNITTAFQDTVVSPGWLAMDAFITTIADTLDIYHAIGRGIRREEKRHLWARKVAEEAIDFKAKTEKTAQNRDRLKATLKRVVSTVGVLKKKIQRRFPKHEEEAMIVGIRHSNSAEDRYCKQDPLEKNAIKRCGKE